MVSAGEDVLRGADVLVPIPLHPRKALSRSFNQADDLARHLPLRRAIAPCVGSRRTAAQAGLGASARAANVRGAFGPSRRLRIGTWAARHGAKGGRLRRAGCSWLARRWSVQGAVVVIVDDVRTTGATLGEAARDCCGRGAHRRSGR